MPKLYACCTDPDCATFRNMIVKLQVWGINPTPHKDGKSFYFDASPDVSGWNKRRRDMFASIVRSWSNVH